jgi:purine-binding chemotaxis protein CheW
MQYATFLIDGLLFGIEVPEVQEVVAFQQMTAVPLAASSVEGLINLRGQIALAIDTRCVMGLPARAAGAPSLNVVVRSEEGIASLVVDDIGDVVDVTDEMRTPVPDTVPLQQKGLLECVYMLPEGLLHVLNVGGLLEGVARSNFLEPISC